MRIPSLAWWGALVLATLVPAVWRYLSVQHHKPNPVDLVMAQAGEELFRHEWTAGDRLAAGGDGLGPVFNAASCVACHFQKKPGGSGALTENVTLFFVPPTVRHEKAREGVVHARSTLERRETLADIDPKL